MCLRDLSWRFRRAARAYRQPWHAASESRAWVQRAYSSRPFSTPVCGRINQTVQDARNDSGNATVWRWRFAHHCLINVACIQHHHYLTT